MTYTNYTITVVNPGSGNVYAINGTNQLTLSLTEGGTYRFDQSDGSNSGHPLRFSATSNGTHGGGTEYTTGVTTAGTPGSSGAYTEIVVATDAPTLYYYCTNHSGMGGTVNTPTSAVVTPELSELFEEAYERAGLQMRNGYDLRTARRSLNLLTLEWQNRGLNLFTIESGTISVTAGTENYTLPSDTIDILEHQIRTGTGTNQIDTALERVSVATYAQQTNKKTEGRPTQIFVQRLSTETKVTLWPVPDSTTAYTIFYYRLKGISGLSSGVGSTINFVPPRFVPCLVSGLAYYIAMKRPEVATRVAPLKQEYEFQFELAAGEDEETASIKFVPYNTFMLGA